MTRRSRQNRERAADAIAKYKEFHRYDPRKVGEFPRSFRIPTRVRLAGDAKWVTYRSGKVDPETLRKPIAPVDYIHDHDAGVRAYLTDGDGPTTDVPSFVLEAPALTRLGYNLGFAFVTPDGEDAEIEAVRPLPDLYTTPCGKALLVIQSRREVLAIMWGGGLGVYARGIDG